MAYAMTVHKAQGNSEYRGVIFVGAMRVASLMVRGVLYTAITPRAREAARHRRRRFRHQQNGGERPPQPPLQRPEMEDEERGRVNATFDSLAALLFPAALRLLWKSRRGAACVPI